MSNRILFIDDDPSILSMMERNLTLDHNVHTAGGAELALETISEHGSFPVVVVDMQMPKFNGIETIAMLREKMPDTVFIMLTGNQDQKTAIQAVNDGRVFRFLNKPCQIKEISAVISEALKHHHQIQSEKELLNGTFAGAINMMTDLIELPDERQIDTSRMASAIDELAQRLSIRIGWEEKVAARVFLVGLSMLNVEEARKFEWMDPISSEHKDIFNKVCIASASMIKKLPRFGWIAELLRAIPDADGNAVSSDRKAIAAVLLRVVFYWNFLTLKGLSAESTTAVIGKVMPELKSNIMEAFQYLHDNRDSHALTSLPISDLREGMVPHIDIDRPGGGQLIRRGRILTSAMIENLSRTPELADHSISIVANSIPPVSRPL